MSDADALCVLYLVWAPLGPEMLGRFVESYRRYSAGADHRLHVLFKGFDAGQNPRAWRRELNGVAHEELFVSGSTLDLGTYREAAELIRAERYCFLNSSSVILAEGWLRSLDLHLRSPRVGMVGVTGSYESIYSTAPLLLRPMRRGFDPFPNPHIRTNGFALERELLLSLDWHAPRRKVEAWRLESGRHGISRQIRERGLGLLVVGRDGRAYPQERWRESATFRSGGQSNQLVADSRTLEYETLNRQQRLRLEQLAWGTDGQR